MSATGDLCRRIIAWPVDHPRLVIAGACALTIAAAISVGRMRPDSSIEAMFARDNPAATAMARIYRDFPAADQLLVLASLPDQRDADPQRLRKFGQRFTAALSADPTVAPLISGAFDRVDDQTRAYFEKVVVPAAIYYLEDRALAAAEQRLSTAEIRRQIEQDKALLSMPTPQAQAFSRLMRLDPLRLHEFIMGRLAGPGPFHTYGNGSELISPDGRSLLVRVIGRKSPNDLEFCQALSEGVRKVAARANTDGLRLQLTGSYAIAAASARAIRRDMIASIVGSVLLLQGLFVLAYRASFGLFALAFGPVALGILLGFGGYALVHPALTPLTAVLGAILAGMGIDYSVQYISFYESRRTAGSAPLTAGREAATEMSPAVLAAWATSVVGFLAIGWSHVKALRDFAVLGTLGLTGSFICAVVLLPMVLALTDRRPTPPRQASHVRFSALPLINWVGRHRFVLLSLSLAAMTAAAIVVVRGGTTLLPLESDLTIMHPRPSPEIDAQYQIAQRFGSSAGSLLVYLRASSPDQLISLAYDVEERLRSPEAKSAGVVSTYGLATLLPDPRVMPARQALISEAQADRVVADFNAALAENGFNPDAFADYAKFLRLLLTPKPPPAISSLISYRRIAETVLPTQAFEGAAATQAITLVFVSKPLDQDRASRDATIAAVRQALNGLPGATVTALGLISHDTEQTVQSELPRLSLIACVIVAIYLAVQFRSLGVALLALLPGIFGMLVALAALRLAGQKLNMINLVAVPLLIGIDVDYGIFLVTLARVRKLGQERADETARRIEPATQAVIVCAAATILGYVSLIWTSVPAEQSLGIAAAVGISACLAGVVFLLLPAIFTLTSRDLPDPHPILPRKTGGGTERT